MLLARFETEIEQSENALKQTSVSLNELQAISSEIRPSERLGKALLDQTKGHLKFIKPHISLASDLLSDHLSWMNLDANYRLQRRILVLTVVVLVATILGVAI